MDTHIDDLTDIEADTVIEKWRQQIPVRPTTIKPLFVWPNRLGPSYFIRLFFYTRKASKSGWEQWYDDATQWYFAVNREYLDLCGARDMMCYPQVNRLNEFIYQERKTQHERTISQIEWNRLSREEKKALRNGPIEPTVDTEETS